MDVTSSAENFVGALDAVAFASPSLRNVDRHNLTISTRASHAPAQVPSRPRRSRTVQPMCSACLRCLGLLRHDWQQDVEAATVVHCDAVRQVR
jgi:hypothetical protein